MESKWPLSLLANHLEDMFMGSLEAGRGRQPGMLSCTAWGFFLPGAGLVLLWGCAHCKATCSVPCQHHHYTHRAHWSHTQTVAPHSFCVLCRDCPNLVVPAWAQRMHKSQHDALKPLWRAVVVCVVAYRSTLAPRGPAARDQQG